MIKEITVKELDQYLEEGCQLVDVREDDEVAHGMIPNSKHFPLSSFIDYKNQIQKDKPVIFYCRSGKRSLKAADLAKDWTEKPVYSLRGGYLEYSASK